MKKEHLQYFICPECGKELELINLAKEESNEIIDGTLACKEGHEYKIINEIPRLLPKTIESTKKETQESFSKKWTTDSVKDYGIDTGPILEFHHKWYLQRYGWKNEEEFKKFLQKQKLILDAGCGVGRDVKWFAEHAKSGFVFGIDISESIDMARENLKGFDNIILVQGDITKPPFRKDFFDFISCDQVIHHTPKTEDTFKHLVKHIKKDGVFSTYTYKIKAPIREFADTFIREKTTKMNYDDCYEFSRKITLLGKALSELKSIVDIPEDIPLLGIKKGKIDVQRFIYWHIMKCFWNEDHGMEASIMTNFDWYHPKDAHRHSPEELKSWASELNLEILNFDECGAGLSIRIKK